MFKKNERASRNSLGPMYTINVGFGSSPIFLFLIGPHLGPFFTCLDPSGLFSELGKNSCYCGEEGGHFYSMEPLLPTQWYCKQLLTLSPT